MDALIFELDQRPVPAAALRDRQACELLRVWVAEKGVHCAMRVGRDREQGMPEEASWGAILAETVRHLARALQRGGGDTGLSIAQIRSAFDNELDFSPLPIAPVETTTRH